MLEKLKRRRRTIIFFAAIYVLFGSAFIYLLFMTPGLDFAQQQVSDELEVFVLNNSMHIINNINVETNTEGKVLEVARLLPGEKKLIPIAEKTGTVGISASAPFHASISRDFLFQEDGTGIGEGNVGIKTTMPSTVFTGIEFEAEIEICNAGNLEVSLSVSEGHDSELLEGTTPAQDISIAAGNCEKAVFAMKALKTGKTKIYFNINALSFSKKVEREITIEE